MIDTPPQGRGDMVQSIQVLRGVAALLVVMFHAATRYDPTESTFRLGNAGVDIFFVISGFVMWTVTARRPAGPVTFLRHRFIRLVPLYWVWTLVLIAGWSVMPSAFPRLHPTVQHVLLSMVFWPHVSPDNGLVFPVLGQGWTLNFEVFFYLLFAGALLLPARPRLTLLAVLLLALPAIGLAWPAPKPPPATVLSPLLIEFLGGIVIARLASGPERMRVLWGWCSAALGFALFLVLDNPAPDDDWARLLRYGGPAWLVVGGAVIVEAGSAPVWGPEWRLPLLLGSASYSLYLTHTFAISILSKVWPASLPPPVFMAAATLFATVGGVIAYLCVEQPLLRALRGRTRGAPPNIRTADPIASPNVANGSSIRPVR